jgi:Tfp pilus assembly protein PilF
MSWAADAFFERALTAIKGRDYDNALALLVETIRLKPDHPEAWICRGNVLLHTMSRPLDALLHFERALSFNPDLHDAWNNRGLAFTDIGLFDEAIASFRKSAALMPAVEPYLGIANIYCTMIRLEQAAAEWRKAIEIDPGCIDAHYNLGVTLLGLGQWDEGFKEYELRLKNTPYPPRAMRDYVKWRGENLNGKRILLYPEQGYGDEIMALRFADALAKRFDGACITILARQPVLRLAESIESRAINVAPMHGETALRADYSCPLLDVPMMLGLQWQDILPLGIRHIDQSPAYLRPAHRELYDWPERLATLHPGLNVGLCWSSGSHFNMARLGQRAKSVPLAMLKPLAMPGVNLISLQKQRTEPIPPGLQITDWMDDCDDFADTAALIDNLDLVISVDTAVAHVAGALGKPVWNFVRFSAYWPWLAPDVVGDPETAIWYASMKLLRQSTLGDWRQPIARAVELLGVEVANNRREAA